MLFVGYERGKRLEDRGNEDEEEDNSVVGDGFELESLADSDSSGDTDGKNDLKRVISANGGLEVPVDGLERVRSRSPHRSTAMD